MALNFSRNYLGKRAQSSGFTWFFALIFIAFWLVIFYLASNLAIVGDESPSAKVVLKYSDETIGLRSFETFSEYADGRTYGEFAKNNLLYNVYNLDEGVLADLFVNFLSINYPAETYGCSWFIIQDRAIGRIDAVSPVQTVTGLDSLKEKKFYHIPVDTYIRLSLAKSSVHLFNKAGGNTPVRTRLNVGGCVK